MAERLKGCITYRGNNSYLLSVSAGNYANGKRKRPTRTVHAKSYEEAEVYLRQFINEIESKQVDSGTSITFREFLEIWNEQYAQLSHKKSTQISNDRTIKANFGRFMNVKLNKITTESIRKWIIWLSKTKKLSPKTVRNNYTLLHGILETAVTWEYLNVNPAHNIMLPKKTHKEAKFYDKSRVERLMQVLDEETEARYLNRKTGVLIALFGGLRRGEICGLDESDVDFEKGVITVRQSRLPNGTGKVYIDDPKTAKSKRVVALPEGVMNAISKNIQYNKLQKETLGELWYDSPALLKNANGKPLYPQSLYRYFKRIQKKYELPSLSLHQLRHTHTAMMVGYGMKLEEVSPRLGHSNINTTAGIYDHLFNPITHVVVDKINEAFF